MISLERSLGGAQVAARWGVGGWRPGPLRQGSRRLLLPLSSRARSAGSHDDGARGWLRWRRGGFGCRRLGGRLATALPPLEGVFLKKASSFPFKWQRRHFALDLQSRVLRYSTTGSPRQLKGEERVVGARHAEPERARPYRFDLVCAAPKGGEKAIQCAAEDEGAKMRWVNAASRSAEDHAALLEAGEGELRVGARVVARRGDGEREGASSGRGIVLGGCDSTTAGGS